MPYTTENKTLNKPYKKIKNGMNVSYKKYHRDITKSVYLCLFLKFKCVPEEYLWKNVEKRHIFTEFYFKCTENQEYKKKLVDILKSHETPRMKDRICINYHVCVFFVFVYLFEKRKKILSKSRQRMT